MSAPRPSFVFGPFRLDGSTERLQRGREEIELPPRPLALLRYFLERPNRLVLKEELLEALWPGTYVTEGVLKTHVNEVRRTLGDDAREPRFLATVHRRGYRFVCEVAVVAEPSSVAASAVAPAVVSEPSAIAAASAEPSFVGREAEVARLDATLAATRAGQRRFVFVAGEAGIGKTTLIDFFLSSRSGTLEIAVGRGQCFEGTGAGEPYGPVLEALGGLARGAHAARIVPLLRRYAPSWVAQLPWLVAEAERPALAQELLGVTRERMLREIAEALEAAAAEVPVLLVLEDLQWSDPATLDLCTAIARRRESARLLVLATYRPADAILAGGTLRRLRAELMSRGQASEILLELLSRDAVAAYITARLSPPSEGLVRALYEQTDGNALFLRIVVDDLIAREALRAEEGGLTIAPGTVLSVPESLRATIEDQVERLPAEVQRWLEAGSLVGPEFEALAVAEATETDPGPVEDALTGLAGRRALIREAGTAELPDGELTARFAFTHSLHQQVLAERPAAVQSARWHLRLGTWLEQSWGEGAPDHAARLAFHYERGHAPLRAARWLRESARIAAKRRTYPEALAALARALELAAELPRTDRLEAERETFELRGLVHRSGGDFVGATDDFAAAADRAAQAGEAAAEVRALLLESSAAFLFDPARADRVFQRARDLAWEVGEPVLSTRVRALAGFGYLRLRGYRRSDDEASERAVATLRAAGDPGLLGEQLARRALFDVVSGRYAAAAAAGAEAAEIAAGVGDPYEFLAGQQYRHLALLHDGAWGELARQLRESIAVAERNGHALWLETLRFQEGWLRCECFDTEAAAALCEGSAERARAIGHVSGESLSLAVAGRAHLAAGRSGDVARCLARLRELLPLVTPSALGVILHLADGEAALDAGDAAGATAAGGRAEADAAAAGDGAHVALARALLAEAALSARRIDAADAAMAGALAVLPKEGARRAAWRVHAAAARLASRRKRPDDARRHRSEAARIVAELVASLDREPESAPLADRMRSAAPVAELMQASASPRRKG